MAQSWPNKNIANKVWETEVFRAKFSLSLEQALEKPGNSWEGGAYLFVRVNEPDALVCEQETNPDSISWK